MTWIVEHEDGDVTQHEEMPGTAGIAEGVRFAETPRQLDFATERWDWDAAGIVTAFTPAEARDMMWEQAKAYRLARQTAPLPIPDVVPGQVVVADCDPVSQEMVFKLVQGATMAIVSQQPFSLTFTDHLNIAFTVDAQQTAAIGAAVLTNLAACHAASQAVRAALDAALDGGATADDIFAIDITAGYPPEGGA